jgi:hypothetical protein
LNLYGLPEIKIPGSPSGNQKEKTAQYVVVGTSSANHYLLEKSC